jgi:DNA-3-methyladenine glycosylase I
MTRDIQRCAWATKPLDIEYHDAEWGVPVHDDRLLFEFLILEGAQAGLSWSTILNKRQAYRKAFANFEPKKVAKFGPDKVATLLENPGIVRNRLKIAASVQNAKTFLKVQDEFGAFDPFLWRFVDGKPIANRWKTQGQVPAKTTVSDALSKELAKRGFKFVGSTICYAFMQAIGMVNDHVVTCYRHKELTLHT